MSAKQQRPVWMEGYEAHECKTCEATGEHRPPYTDRGDGKCAFCNGYGWNFAPGEEYRRYMDLHGEPPRSSRSRTPSMIEEQCMAAWLAEMMIAERDLEHVRREENRERTAHAEPGRGPTES